MNIKVNNLEKILQHNEEINIDELSVYENGYIKGLKTNGEINFISSESTSHKIIYAELFNIKSISIILKNLDQLGVYTIGAYVDTETNIAYRLIVNETEAEYNYEINSNDIILYLNYFNYNKTEEFKIIDKVIVNYMDDSLNFVSILPQSFNDSQKEIARNNIGAISESDINSYLSTYSPSESIVNLNSLNFYHYGWVKSDGSFNLLENSSHYIVSIDASNIIGLKYTLNSSLGSSFAIGCLKDSSDNILQIFKNNEFEYSFEAAEGNTIYISFYDGKTNSETYYNSITIIRANDFIKNIIDAIPTNISTSEIEYKTFIFDNLNLYNKNLAFFGDSITYGYIAANGNVPTHQSINNFPKILSELLDAEYHNYGVSGSTIAVTSDYSSITTKIQSINTATLQTYDAIIIAGGINDWQVGVGITDFIIAVTNLFEYLKTNYQGKVIILTPINEAGRKPIVEPQQTVQSIRNILTRLAIQYEFNVIQGTDLPFPTKNDNADFINLLLADKLHPTDFGYKIYGKSLYGIISKYN